MTATNPIEIRWKERQGKFCDTPGCLYQPRWRYTHPAGPVAAYCGTHMNKILREER